MQQMNESNDIAKTNRFGSFVKNGNNLFEI